MAPDAPRSHRETLRIGEFRAALAGFAATSAAKNAQLIAAGWLAFNVTHRAAAVGAVVIAARLPKAALATYAGTVAYHVGARRAAALLSAALVAQATILAVVAWRGAAFWELVAAMTVMGVVIAPLEPLRQQRILDVVPAAHRRSATTLTWFAYDLAGLVASLAVAALAVGAGGVAACFGLAAVLWAASLRCWGSAEETTGAAAVAAGIPRVVGHLRERRTLLLLSGLAVFTLLLGSLESLAPVLAHAHGEGVHLVGLLVAALAAGGIAGNAVADRLGRLGVGDTRVLGGACLLGGAAALLLADGNHLGTDLAALALVGGAWSAAWLACVNGVRVGVDEAYQVSAAGFVSSVYQGAILGGAFAIGALMDHVGTDPVLTVCGLLTAAWLVVAVGGRRLALATARSRI